MNRTQAAERTERCRFLSVVTLTFDLDIHTRPSEGPSTSSVWIWHKSVQRFPRYFIHKQKSSARNRTLRCSLRAVKIHPYNSRTDRGGRGGGERGVLGAGPPASTRGNCGNRADPVTLSSWWEWLLDNSRVGVSESCPVTVGVTIINAVARFTVHDAGESDPSIPRPAPPLHWS